MPAQQNSVGMSNRLLKPQRPNPNPTDKAKPCHNRGTQSTRSQPCRSTNPPHYNRCDKPSIPHPSRNTTQLTQGIGSYAQGYTPSIREISREVAMLEKRLASLVEMLQSLQPAEEKMDQKRDVNEMDWQFEDTVLINSRKM